MNLNRISNTIKDTSRSIYIQLLAGKTSQSEQLKDDIKALENALIDLKTVMALENSVCIIQRCQESDLKGLAQREALR